MPLYRARRNLRRSGKRILKGTLLKLDNVSKTTLDSLLARGDVSEVAPPPLKILPGWKEPAKKLEAIGVKTALDFLEAPEEPVSRVLKMPRKEVKAKKKEVQDWLMPKVDKPDEHRG